MKTLAEKYKKARKVLILPNIYRKLELESDKSGFPINDLVNMKLNHMYQEQAKHG